MIWIGGKSPTALWIGGKRVVSMWCGADKIWGDGITPPPPPPIRLSCFGSGVWLSAKPWIGSDKWKAHK